jgi:hypothetical protein
MAQLQAALRLRPEYPEALNNLGVLLSQIPHFGNRLLYLIDSAILCGIQ